LITILCVCVTEWNITTTTTTKLLLGRMQHRHMDTNHTYKYTIRWL